MKLHSLSKITALSILVVLMSLYSQDSWGKHPSLVSSVNSLEQIGPYSDSRVLSPASTFFTLVMLENVATGPTKENLGNLTRSDEWKESENIKNRETKATVGWLKMNNVWWVDGWIRPSENFNDSCSHFRTEIRSGDLRDIERGKPWSDIDIPRIKPGAMDESLLWTEAEFAPMFKGGLSPAPSSALGHSSKDSPFARAKYLQTSIINARLKRDPDGNIKIEIPLTGSSEITLQSTREPIEGEYLEVPIILFLPEITLTNYYRPLKIYGLDSLRGPESDYGKYELGSKLELSDWITKASVLFRAHPAPVTGLESPEKIKPTPPLVIKMTHPFFFEIRGSHGEKLFVGHVSEKDLK